MKSLALVFLLGATSAFGALQSPKHVEFSKSLGSPMVSVAPGALWLVWDYPAAELGNIYFEVYHCPSLSAGAPPLDTYISIPSGFTLLSNVDLPPVQVGGLAADFFIVRARDLTTGVYSNWNQ